MNNSEHTARIKKAELLSSVGAGVLGAGIALLLAKILAGYAIPILLLGLMSHAGGMFQKHSLEQQNESIHIWWVDVLYWLCWVALAVMLLFVVVRQF